MIGIILAAGKSLRLKEHTEDTPKCLLDVGGKTMLGRQIEQMRDNGINKIIIVIGFQAPKILKYCEEHYNSIDNEFIISEDYETTNNAHSLNLALKEIKKQGWNQDFLLFNADVVCHGNIVKLLVNSEEYVVAYQTKDVLPEEDMKLIINENNSVQNIGKQLPPEICSGEFTGMAKLSKDVIEDFIAELDKCRPNDWFEHALDRLVNYTNIKGIDATNYSSIEIDFPSDLEAARKIFPYE